ncbi:MAG TPA: matrixin family metalloprotease [Candidatus Acidoferrales bacterium]|nr:matrixin family metalloprotease [Candidatus Acidoferrales bacterium]
MEKMMRITTSRMRNTGKWKKLCVVPTALLFLCAGLAPCGARGYAFNYIVADMRQPVSVSGGSACPVPAHFLTSAASINRRWSTALNTNPVSVLTVDQTAAGRLNEIEAVIQSSFATWAGVSGASLTGSSLGPLGRSGAQNACAADGVNSICFDQSDAAFTPGVLAFTRVMVADRIGETLGAATSSEVGQILDADIELNPGDPQATFATPAALPNAPSAYDLESILTHELGHFLGFSHSAVWPAMMYPFAPSPGTFTGDRPTSQAPDAPLSNDDRTGLRALYPDPSDTVNVGTISGRILAANPLSLPSAPAGVTGLFGAYVVAMDANSGEVLAGVLGGWTCSGAGPAQFDGGFRLTHLPVGTGRSYKIYAEPLNGTVDPSQVSNATATLCRNALTDPGWPAPSACVVPGVTTNLMARVRPGP